MHIIRGIVAAIGIGIAASAAHAASCDRERATVEIGVHEAGVVMSSNTTLADLGAMSRQFGQSPAHPVLGFYSGGLGYVLRKMEILPVDSNGVPCTGIDVQAELVALDRRIALASDVSIPRCRLKAAEAHYGHHAEAASRALHQFAADLPLKLSAEINSYARHHGAQSEEQQITLRQFVNGLLDQAIEAFSASLKDVQKRVDTPAEISALTVPCSDT